MSLVVMVMAIGAYGYKATINFYNSEKLNSTTGTNLTKDNYAQFVSVAAGQKSTDIVTGVTITGKVRYGMNGGLTVGTGSTNDDSVEFTLGQNVIVTKCTVWATNYDSGKWKLNGNNADSGSCGAKSGTLASVKTPYVWDKLTAKTLSFTKCTTDSKEGECKRMTILKIEIEYTVDGNAGASVAVTGVSLDASSKELTKGESVTLVATVAPTDASNQLIAWSSSEEEVATVKNGEVVAIAPGTATITAKTEDGNFTASCEVTVKKFVGWTIVFAPNSSSTSDSNNAYSDQAGMDKIFSTGYEYVDSAPLNNVYPARNALVNGAKFGSSSTAGEITINLKNPVKASKFIISAAPYGDTEGKEGFILKISDSDEDSYSVTMSTGENKKYANYLVNLGETKDISKITLANNAGKRIYVESIAIIVEEFAEVQVSEVCYSTYYNSAHAYIMPEGWEGLAAKYDNHKGTLALNVAYQAFDVVPAGEPLIIRASEPGAKDIVFVASNAKPSTDNDLLGTDESTALEADDTSYFYALSLNKGGDPNSVGFYWMNETGAAFTNGAHKAYLKLANPAASKIKQFVFADDATAISTVSNAADDAEAIYSVSGAPQNTMKKGINIVKAGGQVKKVYVK